MSDAGFRLFKAPGETIHLETALWLDSHLTKAVVSGKKSFIYATNNGTTVFDNVLYVFGGTGVGISKFVAFDDCVTADMIDAADTTEDYTFTNTRKIKISIDGVDYYLIADRS